MGDDNTKTPSSLGFLDSFGTPIYLYLDLVHFHMFPLSFFTKVWKGRRRIEFNRTQGLFFGLSETEVFVCEFIWCFSILLVPLRVGGQWLTGPGQELISVTDKFSTKLDPLQKMHSSTSLKDHL